MSCLPKSYNNAAEKYRHRFRVRQLFVPVAPDRNRAQTLECLASLANHHQDTRNSHTAKLDPRCLAIRHGAGLGLQLFPVARPSNNRHDTSGRLESISLRHLSEENYDIHLPKTRLTADESVASGSKSPRRVKPSTTLYHAVGIPSLLACYARGYRRWWLDPHLAEKGGYY